MKRRRELMADYIDRNNECIDIWDTTGNGSCPVNPDDPTPSTDENLERWRMLLKDWDSMSFKERLKFFVPIVHIILIPDTYPSDFDEEINNQIVEYAYKWCRSVRSIKPNIDDHRVPFFTVVYNPINVNAIPDSTLKAKVLSWVNTVQPLP